MERKCNSGAKGTGKMVSTPRRPAKLVTFPAAKYIISSMGTPPNTNLSFCAEFSTRAEMNRKIECRSDGCSNEVLFKTLEGGFNIHQPNLDHYHYRDHRRSSTGAGPRSPAGAAGRHLSPYCKQHTCVHFHREECCANKKPPHDTVCAVHTRCPIPDCNQARAQFLDPNFDPLSNAVPRYARYEVCADHKCIVRRCPQRRASTGTVFCQAHECRADGCSNERQDRLECCEKHQCHSRGCDLVVEANHTLCAHHITCEMNGCGGAKHFDPKTKEHLPYCTNHATCPVSRCKQTKVDRQSAFCDDHTCRERGCNKSTRVRPYCDDHRCAEIDCAYPIASSHDRFCPLHTCRAQDCREYVNSFSIFCQSHGCSKPKCPQQSIVEYLCLDHLKKHYTTLGRRSALTPASSQFGTIKSDTIVEDSSTTEDEDYHDQKRPGIKNKPPSLKDPCPPSPATFSSSHSHTTRSALIFTSNPNNSSASALKEVSLPSSLPAPTPLSTRPSIIQIHSLHTSDPHHPSPSQRGPSFYKTVHNPNANPTAGPNQPGDILRTSPPQVSGTARPPDRKLPTPTTPQPVPPASGVGQAHHPMPDTEDY
ncbi:hypothetical protein QBC36DRAFT_330444 [Triangularia setosa]|uniref:Uncharacterized protein n=1 Tax=Triangularia setosa TaxID=2587417 RepID=A0AAN6W827_9PEZI|nr:hypothetical protein QBC36DRAFT_330444 [Podospora setosa]